MATMQQTCTKGEIQTISDTFWLISSDPLWRHFFVPPLRLLLLFTLKSGKSTFKHFRSKLVLDLEFCFPITDYNTKQGKKKLLVKMSYDTLANPKSPPPHVFGDTL